MIKKAWLTILTILIALPLHAQHTQDTAFIFHFHPGNDFFHASYQNNDKELQRLADVLEQQHSALENGMMYINVSSYATTGNEKTDATRIAYLCNSRIKSELIVRHRITEQMFLTDKHIVTPYGSETADKIRAYYKEQKSGNVTNETAPNIKPTKTQETRKWKTRQ